MKVRVKVRPLGLLNGYPWPEVGESVDLPDAVAKDMVASGAVEEAKAAKKACAKPDKSEKATASKADVETRKGK